MSKDFQNEFESQDELLDEFEEIEEEYGGDEEMEDFREYQLELEDGTILKCLVMAKFFVEEQGYIALLPYEQESSILLYRCNYEENDVFDISMIDSEEEFEAASEAYYREVGELDFDFSDGCDCEDCNHEHHHHDHD